MDLIKLHFVVLILTCNFVLPHTVLPLTPGKISEDAKLDFLGLSYKYGKPAEEYQVVTEDGYILTVHHIPGKRCPVFLQHGVLDTSDTFIMRGFNSIAITLADAGYDLWFGNTRGNRYSRKHISLDPDTDKRYWNYTVHEIGFYDLPAMIDLVLKETGEPQLTAIGHSQGNAVFFVLGASRPEYNDKVKVLIAMAPIAFLHNLKPPLNVLVNLGFLVNDILLATNHEELFSDYSSFKMLLQAICTQLPFKYDLCMTAGLFVLAGADPNEYDTNFVDVIFGHYPAGVGRKNVLHFTQIAKSKRFKQFDYGSEGNKIEYGRETAPEYDLSKVTMRVELFTGRNDKLSTIEDVTILNNKLPNAVFRLLDRKQMNHLDFVWGKNIHKYLLPLIFQVLQRFC